jgi:hypothetical protein
MIEPTVFGPEATEQLAKTVREVARRVKNEAPIRARWQHQAGGGTGHHIWFTIDSVICNDDDTKTLIVTATWYTGGCEATIPGEDDYGLIEVDDPCRLLEFYTAEWLESGSIVGRATYMYPRTGDCVPRWLVDTICGTPECA